MSYPRRIGKVEISAQMIEENWDQLHPFFKKFIPVHIDYQQWRKIYVYIGYSQFFEECRFGDEAPLYSVTFHTETGRSTFVTMEKQ